MTNGSSLPPRAASEILLQVEDIHKTYAVPVLRDIRLDLRAGEVHALVGENGAGKSTLARIMAGLTRPDRGRMILGGQAYAPASRREAERAGVRMVMQELNLINTLSVAENIYFGSLPHRLGWIDYPKLLGWARRDLQAVGLDDIDPAIPVGQLGVGQQQLVEIAAAISHQSRILILDEPTAALTDPQIELLFQHLRRLQMEGVGILYISHRLEEIQRIANRVTVLRDGCLIDTQPVARISLDQIIRLMAGRAVAEQTKGETSAPGKVALRVHRLCRGACVRGVSFVVHHGEILGFAGLIGSGRTETLRAVFGADRAESGEVWRGEEQGPLRIRHPVDAVRAGIGMIPEDRKQQGLLLPQSVRANMTFPSLDQVSRAWGWIDLDGESERVQRFAALLDLRSASIEQPVSELSGGNQQKVVMARWLMRQCEVLLFDEPTRGIDVAAKWTIHQLLRDLACQGKAIVVVSSDLLELLAICDRIAVLSAGRVTGMFSRATWSQEAIMAAAFHGYLGRGNAQVGGEQPAKLAPEGGHSGV
jgi:ribose transport system ATP-binding protein